MPPRAKLTARGMAPGGTTGFVEADVAASFLHSSWSLLEYMTTCALSTISTVPVW